MLKVTGWNVLASQRPPWAGVAARRMEGGRGLICAFRRGYFSFLLSFSSIENAPTMQAHSPNDSGRCRSWNLCTAQLCPRLAPCPSILLFFTNAKLQTTAKVFFSTNFSVLVLLLCSPRPCRCPNRCVPHASSSSSSFPGPIAAVVRAVATPLQVRTWFGFGMAKEADELEASLL